MKILTIESPATGTKRHSRFEILGLGTHVLLINKFIEGEFVASISMDVNVMRQILEADYYAWCKEE